jgi:hypothetical protein
MNVLDKARTDKRVQAVLTDVSNQSKLKFSQSIDDDGWGSNVEDDKATIFWAGCRHPSASLMHELLHVQLQLNGYKRIRISISNIADAETSKRLMDCIDNEVQHHKIYAAFLGAGFKPEQFYRDSDSGVEAFLEREIDGGLSSTAAVSIVFFTLIAPGGGLSDVAKARLRARFDALDSGKHGAAFRGIESAIADWIASPNADATQYIKRILLAIQPADNLTWYGFSATDHPKNGSGIFADHVFSVGEPKSATTTIAADLVAQPPTAGEP